MTDFSLTNHGSIWLLRPLTEEAKDWVENNLGDDVTTFAGAIVVEPRYVENIVYGIRGDGLTV